MTANEARAIQALSSESIYSKVYNAIKDAAERGENSVRVIPCTDWFEFYEHFTSMGYEVSEFFYPAEEDVYAEISW